MMTAKKFSSVLNPKPLDLNRETVGGMTVGEWDRVVKGDLKAQLVRQRELVAKAKKGVRLTANGQIPIPQGIVVTDVASSYRKKVVNSR